MKRWVLEKDEDVLASDDFVTHRLPLADAAEAYALLQAKRDGAIKVVLSPEPRPAAQPDG